MDKLIKKLFDYQKFEENQKLKNVIYTSEQYVGEYLTDEQLSFVYGGVRESQTKEEKMKKTEDKQ